MENVTEDNSLNVNTPSIAKQCLNVTDPCFTNTRKRKCDLEEWCGNKRKIKSQLSEEHVTSRGKIRDARNLIKIGDHQKCRFKCYEDIPEANRQEICHDYWSKGDWIRQKDFILHHVKVVEVATGNENAMQNRKESQRFYLQNGENLYRTFKYFFSKKLCISNTVIDNVLSKKSSNGEFVGEDGCGYLQ